MDEELITPPIDATNHFKLKLTFNKNYRVYMEEGDYDQIAEVDVRVKDPDTGAWGDWINLLRFDGPTAAEEYNTTPEEVDLSAYDESEIQLRWHYYDAFNDYWFAIDDIIVSGEPKEVGPGIVYFTGLAIVDGNLELEWGAVDVTTYYVEYRADLMVGDWEEIAGPLTLTHWSTAIPAGTVEYYRVRGE